MVKKKYDINNLKIHHTKTTQLFISLYMCECIKKWNKETHQFVNSVYLQRLEGGIVEWRKFFTLSSLCFDLFDFLKWEYIISIIEENKYACYLKCCTNIDTGLYLGLLPSHKECMIIMYVASEEKVNANLTSTDLSWS